MLIKAFNLEWNQQVPITYNLYDEIQMNKDKIENYQSNN